MSTGSKDPDFTRAVCRTSSKPYWDLEVEGEKKHQRVHRHLRAKMLCETCPILVECRIWADENSSEAERLDGIWGAKVRAPDDFKYPRCKRCDRPLAVTMTAVAHLLFGYALPHPYDLTVCVECGEFLGYGTIADEQRIDGVKQIVADPGRYVLTSTIVVLEEPRFPKRRHPQQGRYTHLETNEDDVY